MLYKTKGIVLSFIKFKETSIIVKIFTEEFGLKSYIVNRVRGTSKNVKIALFQPFTMLDLVVYNRKNTSIHRISEAQINYPLKSIPYHIQKSTICMFLGEVLIKSIQEEETHIHESYYFLEQSIITLDQKETFFELFHLQFLIKWCDFLGISMPRAEVTEQLLAEHQTLYLPEASKMYFDQLILSEYEDNLQIPSEVRSELLDYILKFYAIHLDQFRQLKSLDVLRML